MRIYLSKNTLNNLYWKEGLSTAEIAKRYNCTHSGILYKMQSFGIKRRSKLGLRKPVKISKKVLKNLYEHRKLSETKVANLLGRSRGAIERKMKLYGIKPRGYRESNTKYPKKDFSKNLTEKAYLIGFRLGDLSVSRRGYLIHIGCSSTIPAQVKLIKKLFSPYTFVYTKLSRILNGKQVVDIQCLLNESFAFLLPKQDNIETWILKSNKYFFAFMAGYIDAEGHIYTRYPSIGKGCMPFSGIEVGTYDKNILFQIWTKLNQLNIECPKPLLNKPAEYQGKNGLKTGKDCWRLSVSKKKSLISVFNNLNPYLRHGKRRDDMEVAWKNVLTRI